MNQLTEHQRGLLAVLLTAVLWSSGGLFVKLISLSAMQISFFRCLIAAFVFLVIFRKQALYFNGFALINSLFYAIVLITFVIATKTTTAANAIFLQSTAPIYVLIFEPILFRTRYERINIITIVVCFTGMILFFTGELSPGHLEGNLIALIAGIAFAALFLGLRKNKNEYQIASIFYGNIFVALVCIPYITNLEHISLSDLWMVTFLGVFQIGVAYAIFSYGLRRVFAIEASMISLMEPVLNPVWVFIGYGEKPSVMAIAGGIIIIGAIAMRMLIIEMRNRRIKKSPAV